MMGVFSISPVHFHRVLGWFGLEKNLKIISFHFPCSARPGPFRATLFKFQPCLSSQPQQLPAALGSADELNIARKRTSSTQVWISCPVNPSPGIVSSSRFYCLSRGMGWNSARHFWAKPQSHGWGTESCGWRFVPTCQKLVWVLSFQGGFIQAGWW